MELTKPEYILLSADRRIKVSGFDILWVMEGTRFLPLISWKSTDNSRVLSLCRAGEVLTAGSFWGNRVKNRGRETHLSAVQRVDHRADLYSLGVILFGVAYRCAAF